MIKHYKNMLSLFSQNECHEKTLLIHTITGMVGTANLKTLTHPKENRLKLKAKLPFKNLTEQNFIIFFNSYFLLGCITNLALFHKWKGTDGEKFPSSWKIQIQRSTRKAVPQIITLEIKGRENIYN